MKRQSYAGPVQPVQQVEPVRTPAERAIAALTDDKLAMYLQTGSVTPLEPGAAEKPPTGQPNFDLGGSSVTVKGIKLLVERAQELRMLSVVGCAEIGGAEAFREIGKLVKLATLRVSGAQLTGEVVAVLKAYRALKRLEVYGKPGAAVNSKVLPGVLVVQK